MLNDLVLPPNQHHRQRNNRRISMGIIVVRKEERAVITIVVRKVGRVVIKRIANNKLGIRGVKVVEGVIITTKSNNRGRNKRLKRRRHRYYLRMRLRNDWHVLKSMALLKV